MDIDPNLELHFKEKAEKERQKSDRLYAIKLVEKIVFGFVTLMGVAVIGALLKLVIIG